MLSWAVKRRARAPDEAPAARLKFAHQGGSRALSVNKVAKDRERLRICVGCRALKPRPELMRLTVDHKGGQVVLADSESRTVHGRSAYICKAKLCLDTALKGSRLLSALAGRKRKDGPAKRKVAWPLEPQLIRQMERRLTERAENVQEY